MKMKNGVMGSSRPFAAKERIIVLGRTSLPLQAESIYQKQKKKDVLWRFKRPHLILIRFLSEKTENKTRAPTIQEVPLLWQIIIKMIGIFYANVFQKRVLLLLFNIPTNSPVLKILMY